MAVLQQAFNLSADRELIIACGPTVLLWGLEQARGKMAILPDILAPDLKVVFCGTAAGNKSARLGAYYAGPGNQFWSTLNRVGLTPRQLRPDEFASSTDFGLGLTDLAKKAFGTDNQVSQSNFDIQGLVDRIRRFAPQALAFNGKRAAQEFFGRTLVDYGYQSETIEETKLFVLPSTSAAARGYWDEAFWQQLAHFLEDNSIGGANERNKTVVS